MVRNDIKKSSLLRTKILIYAFNGRTLFCTAFCTKTPCVQHQNALHLAPKRTAFCCKMHSILLQITSKQVQTASKQVQIAAFSNKYSSCRMHMPTLFCIKTNLRENRFFAARLAVGAHKKALKMLNLVLKIRQNTILTVARADGQQHECVPR